MVTVLETLYILLRVANQKPRLVVSGPRNDANPLVK